MTKLIVRIDLGGAGHIGPGKIMLLERIGEYGSISAAGRSMSMSYRQAWELVEDLNKSFRDPVVVSQVGGRAGGGAVLTEEGKALIRNYRSIATKASRAAKGNLETIGKAVRASPSAAKRRGAHVRGRTGGGA